MFSFFKKERTAPKCRSIRYFTFYLKSGRVETIAADDSEMTDHVTFLMVNGITVAIVDMCSVELVTINTTLGE